MPRKRKVSGTRKRAREVRQLRSGRTESEGDSSDSSANTEIVEEIAVENGAAPAHKPQSLRKCKLVKNQY